MGEIWVVVFFAELCEVASETCSGNPISSVNRLTGTGFFHKFMEVAVFLPSLVGEDHTQLSVLGYIWGVHGHSVS